MIAVLVISQIPNKSYDEQVNPIEFWEVIVIPISDEPMVAGSSLLVLVYLKIPNKVLRCPGIESC